MHICLVSREYPTDNHVGGIGTYTEKTARGLAALGHVVTVITETQERPSRRLEHGVRVLRLAAQDLRPAELRLLARARAVSRAIRRLPEVPDIVQICEWQAEGFWYALRVDPRTKLVTRLATPTFLVERLNSHGPRAGLRPRLTGARTSVVDRAERLQTTRSDAIISPTAALAQLVCERWRLPRSRIAIVPTGVDFAQRYAGEAAILPEQVRNRDYVIYFGRLEERKGVHILAQALPGVLAAYPNLHVVFAGNSLPYGAQSMDGYVRSCTSAYGDRVHFFPRLQQQALYPLLQHALFAVLPSLWENLANTCLEALDMGLPVVATHGCGFSEVIEDGRSGVLVPPGDVEALQSALLSLLGDRIRLADMAGAARQTARRFALPAVIGTLVEVYDRVNTGPRAACGREDLLPKW